MKKILTIISLMCISWTASAATAIPEDPARGFSQTIDVYNSRGQLTRNVKVAIGIDGSNLPFLHSDAPTYLNIYLVEKANGNNDQANAKAAVRFFFDLSSGRISAIRESGISYRVACVELKGHVTEDGGRTWNKKTRRILGSAYESGDNIDLSGPDNCELN